MGEFCDDGRPEGAAVVGADAAVDSLDVLQHDPLAVPETTEPCLLLFPRPVVLRRVPPQFEGDASCHVTALGRLSELGHGRVEELHRRVVKVRVSFPQCEGKVIGRIASGTAKSAHRELEQKAQDLAGQRILAAEDLLPPSPRRPHQLTGRCALA